MCRQGLRKTHVRSDPAYRFHGSDARGNTAVAHGDTARSTGHAAPGDGDGEEPARPRHVPFEQMTRFVTKGGLAYTIFLDLLTNGYAVKSSTKQGNGMTASRSTPH